MLLGLLATAGPALAAPAFLDQGFILVAPATGNFAAGFGAPSVDYDVATGTWAMYFEAPVPTLPPECTTAYSIGRATSADGINWTIDAEPVLGPDLGTPGSPFHCVASQPAVVYDGATWHLFFTMASEPIGVGQPDTSTGIGYATSTDGVHFTVQAAPLIPYDGVSMGLASAAIVDRVLTLIYVWRPDFRLATLPLDGATNWTLDADPVLRSESAGAWALQWVLGPSLYCEDDQTDPFSLVFGGDDNANVRNLGYAQSPDARQGARRRQPARRRRSRRQHLEPLGRPRGRPRHPDVVLEDRPRVRAQGHRLRRHRARTRPGRAAHVPPPGTARHPADRLRHRGQQRA